MPKVSVIITVYNTEEYLRECLDSVIGQTLHDIEIICVNDGSTDGSLAVLEDYAGKDTRIRVISKRTGEPFLPEKQVLQLPQGNTSALWTVMTG